PYEPVELIVVDDGSTDDSVEVILRYRDDLLAIVKPNGGQASAFNVGFAIAKGEVILFLDADDLLAEGAFQHVVQPFADPNVVKVHWPMLLVDESGRSLGRPFPDGVLADGDRLDRRVQLGAPNPLGAPGG